MGEFNRTVQLLRKQITALEEENQCKDREIELLNESLNRERKERTLITVPSLQSLQGDLELADEENFQMKYNEVGQKEIEKIILEREISNLREEIDSLKLLHSSKVEGLENECGDYIQEIIKMKLKVADSEMRSLEKENQCAQMKKKYEALNNSKIIDTPPLLLQKK